MWIHRELGTKTRLRSPLGQRPTLQRNLLLAVLQAFIACAAACERTTEPRRCPLGSSVECWTSLGLEGVTVASIAEAEGVLFAGTLDGVLRYDVQTGRWLTVGFAGKSVSSITAVRPGVLWVTVAPHGADTSTAVAFVSSDSGVTWSARDGGLAADDEYHAVAFTFAASPADSDVLFLGLSPQLARSIDGGASWSYVYRRAGDRGHGVYRIFPAGLGSQRVYAGGRDDLAVAIVLRSDDLGATWSVVRPQPSVANAVTALAVDPRSDARVVVGMHSAIWMTEDAALSWRIVATTAHPGWVRDFLSQDSLLLAIADEDTTRVDGPSSVLGLYGSWDGGFTWRPLPAPSSAAGGTCVVATRDGRLVVGTRSGVWVAARP